MVLEGNEVDQKFDGGAGSVVVDVDMKGSVKVAVSYDKKISDLVTAKASLGVETNIFKILKEITSKTSTKWDDAAVDGLMKLLGITDEAVVAEAKTLLVAA